MTVGLPSSPSPVGSERARTAALLVLVLIGAVTLGVLSAFFDARAAVAAKHLPATLVVAARYVSDLGLSGYMFALSALVALGAFLARRKVGGVRAKAFSVLGERAVFVLAVLAVSGILAQLCKHLIGRARPKLMGSSGPYQFHLLSVKASLASFPSGHSTTVFAMAFALSLFLPRWRVPLFALAALIGVARVMVEAHYVSDVVAGALLGIGSAVLVIRFCATSSVAFEREGKTVRIKEMGVLSRRRSGAVLVS